MKNIKEWVSPVGIVVLVILASLIKMDTSNMGKSHGRGAKADVAKKHYVAKKHSAERGRGVRGERRGERRGRMSGKIQSEWRKALEERMGQSSKSKSSGTHKSPGRPSRKK